MEVEMNSSSRKRKLDDDPAISFIDEKRVKPGDTTIFDMPKNLKDKILWHLSLKDRMNLRLVSRKFAEFEKEAWVEAEQINIMRVFEGWFPRAIGANKVSEIRKMLQYLFMMYENSPKVKRIVNWRVPMEGNDPQVLFILLKGLIENPPPIAEKITQLDLADNLLTAKDFERVAKVFKNLELMTVDLDNLCMGEAPKEEDKAMEHWKGVAFEKIETLVELRFIGKTVFRKEGTVG